MKAGADGAFLAFDLGATSWRAVLGRERGDRFEIEEIARRRNTPIERGGGLFWDMEGIFRGMKGVLGDVARQGPALAAIGIDSWSIDYGLIDGTGALLEPPRSYRDRRNLGMRKKVAPRLGPRDLFRRTGLMAEDITTLCQLTAARRDTPGLLDRAARLLFIPDLLRYWLTGAQATDFTLATTSQLYDLERKRWDEEILSTVGFSAGVMPPVRTGPGVLAPLGEAVRRETGLGAVPVATGASHDTAAAFSIVPADERGAILSSGTWSIMGVHLERPLFLDSLDPERFGYEGNSDGTVRLICNIPGMWILEQCLDSWRKGGRSFPYEELVAGAREASSFDSRIDPYAAAFEAPEDMPAAIGAYCSGTGQRAPDTPYETARAIFLGLAEAYAAMLAELRRITGRPIGRLHVLGGGSRNRLLNGFVEERAGVEVIVGEAEATAVGNILNQRRALQGWGGPG